MRTLEPLLSPLPRVARIARSSERLRFRRIRSLDLIDKKVPVARHEAEPQALRIWTPPFLQATSGYWRGVRLHTYIRPVGERLMLWPVWIIRASGPDRPFELVALCGT